MRLCVFRTICMPAKLLVIGKIPERETTYSLSRGARNAPDDRYSEPLKGRKGAATNLANQDMRHVFCMKNLGQSTFAGATLLSPENLEWRRFRGWNLIKRNLRGMAPVRNNVRALSRNGNDHW